MSTLVNALKGFHPRDIAPMLVDLASDLVDSGYSVAVSFDFFDVYAYDHADEPVLAVKIVKNKLSPEQMARLTVDKTPMKVVLVEGDRPDIEHFLGKSVFLASSGTGVFVRGVGWLSFPRMATRSDIEQLQYKMSPKWRHDEELGWLKTCRSCGLEKGPEQFYDSASPTARDPKRNFCRTCMSERQSSRRST